MRLRPSALYGARHVAQPSGPRRCGYERRPSIAASTSSNNPGLCSAPGFDAATRDGPRSRRRPHQTIRAFALRLGRICAWQTTGAGRRGRYPFGAMSAPTITPIPYTTAELDAVAYNAD